MANVFQPFGLKAKHSPSGVVRPQRWVVPASDVVTNAGSWARLYQDDAIYFDANGRLQLTSGTNPCVGSFMGVEYNDSTGRRTVSNQFNAALVSNLTANNGLGTSDVWFWLYTDPNLVFEIQLAQNAAGGAFTTTSPTFAVVGNLLTYQQASTTTSQPQPNAVTGFSTGFAYPASATTAGSGAFIVYNYSYDNNPQNTYVTGTPVGIGSNTWADSYPTVLVRLANAQFNGSMPQF